MRLAQILTVLSSEPAFIMPDYRASLLELFHQHMTLAPSEFRATRTGKAKSGSDLDVEQMEIRNGVAIIPIGGPIGLGLGEFEKGAGAVDMDDISNELAEAEANDDVNGVILNFDTPGGMVMGLPELADRIAACEKPVYSFTRGTMASAGYYLAAASDGIFSTKSARVGCIGVCVTYLDLTKMAEMEGIKVKVFGSGMYKGMGTPGTSLTAEQEMWMKGQVRKLADMFYHHVRENRGAIADEDMQGQTFTGEDALGKGFVDGIMGDIGDLETFLRESFVK